MNDIYLRIISTLILLFIGFCMIATNDYIFLLIVQFFYLLSLWEYLRLIKFKSLKFEDNIIKSNFLLSKTKIDIKNFLLILSLIISSIFFYFNFFITSLLLFSFCIYSLVILNKENFLFPLGIVYISLPFYFLIYLSYLSDFKVYILFVIFFSLLVDTSAYLLGSRIGGRKLAPLISPNKTISGALGGIFIPSFICVIIFYDKDLLLNIIFFSILFSCTVQSGDLLESKFKRICGVKDSSNIIPGHGGVLDRFDGIFLFLILISLLTILDYNLFFIS